MAETQYLDYAGLTHYDGKIKEVALGSATIAGQIITLKSVSGAVIGTVEVPKTIYEKATSTTDGLLSKEGFVKLEGISEGATKVEENATNGKLTIDGTAIDVYIHPTGAALASGIYKITTDATGHVTAGTAVQKSDLVAMGLPAQDTTYEDATQTVHGLMSTADKTKLDGISEGATKVVASGTNGHITVDGVDTTVYTHEAFTAKESGLYKITVNAEGHVFATSAVQKSDITALGIPAQDTTYTVATASKDGLESSAHFSKVESVETGAQVNIIEKVSINGSALPVNSKGVNIDLTNYVQKEDVASALEWKGSVDTFTDLPASAEVGDMYNVKTAWTDDEGKHTAGTNVAWNGTKWDAMATAVTIASISNSDIDSLFA